MSQNRVNITGAKEAWLIVSEVLGEIGTDRVHQAVKALKPNFVSEQSYTDAMETLDKLIGTQDPWIPNPGYPAYIRNMKK